MSKAPSAKPPLKERPTRERILRASLHLFQAQGYHATGVAEILARSKAPKGSFYRHFPGGKEELAIIALEWLETEGTGFLDQIVAEGGKARDMMLGLTRHAGEGLRNPERMRGSLLAVLAQKRFLAHRRSTRPCGVTQDQYTRDWWPPACARALLKPSLGR